MAVETQAPRDAERVAVSRKASKSVYYTPCASPVVTCLGSGTRMALKRVPSLLKTPSCFGGGAGAKGGRSSGRVKDSEWQEMAMKSHRLLQHHQVKRKLSTSRVALLNNAHSKNGVRSPHAGGAEKSEKGELQVVDREIEELERELIARLAANVVSEMAALESAAHGSLSFLSEDLDRCKAEFMTEHTLRRFLIARGWDVPRATEMLMEYYRWREANPVGGIGNREIETSLRAEKVYMLKERDWQGRPVLVVVATRHVVENQSLEETIKFVQYCTDKIMHLAMDDEAGVSKMCVFVDLRAVGGHCLDKTALGTMLELMQNYFPERLGTAILWKPPTIFWLAWKLIHNFIPKETRRRMCFAYKQKDVAKFMDPAFVPQLFGGSHSNDILTPIEDA